MTTDPFPVPGVELTHLILGRRISPSRHEGRTS